MTIIKRFLIFCTILLILSNFNIAQTKFVIVHFNDTHARLLENNKSIGYPKISTFLKQLRKDNDHVLYLDAGDTLHGTVATNLSKGILPIEILNYLKIDVLAPGNHDFNYGTNVLLNDAKKAKFHILSANVVKNNKAIFEQNTIITLNKEVKIGIFGLSTPETKYKTHPNNVIDIDFLDITSTAKQQVKILKSQGANFIIAVGHLGIDQSTIDKERSTILANVPGIDLIIDGHSHTELPHGLKAGNTLITQTGKYDENMGLITVTIDETNHKKLITAKLLPKKMFDNIKPDPKVQQIIAKYTKKQEKQLNKVLAKTEIYLNGARELVRSQQTNLGTLITKALKNDLNTDIAFINGGSIRDSIETGTITLNNVLTVLPFGNIATKIEISGKQLKEVLEYSVANVPNTFGGFLQTTGLSYIIDTQAPTGQKIVNLKINGNPIKNNKIYTAATLDFLIIGGDGYTMLKSSKIISSSDALDQVLTRYLKKIQVIDHNILKNNITIK